MSQRTININEFEIVAQACKEQTYTELLSLSIPKLLVKLLGKYALFYPHCVSWDSG